MTRHRATHTPGPWELDLSSQTRAEVFQGGFRIATVRKLQHAWDEQVQNARLIASAPDLLEVLEECAEYFDQRADAEYETDSAIPIANEEMHLLTLVRNVLRKAGAA